MDKKSKIKDHEVNCGSRPVKCLDEDCVETVNLDQFVIHSKQKHESRQFKSQDKIDAKFKAALEESDIYWFHDFHTLNERTYIPIIWKKDGIYRIMLYILTGEDESKKQRVTISISGKDFKMTYTTNVVSIDTSIDEAKSNEENYMQLLSFPAKLCVSKDGGGNDVLSFEFKVLKT
jgi:hypothetical protein